MLTRNCAPNHRSMRRSVSEFPTSSPALPQFLGLVCADIRGASLQVTQVPVRRYRVGHSLNQPTASAKSSFLHGSPEAKGPILRKSRCATYLETG